MSFSSNNVKDFTRVVAVENCKLKDQIKKKQQENIKLNREAESVKLQLSKAKAELADLEKKYELVNLSIENAKKNKEILLEREKMLTHKLQLVESVTTELEDKAKVEFEATHERFAETKVKEKLVHIKLEEKIKAVELLEKDCDKDKLLQLDNNLGKTSKDLEHLEDYFEQVQEFENKVE